MRASSGSLRRSSPSLADSAGVRMPSTYPWTSASFSASRSSFDIRPPCERPFHALAQLAPEAEERAADGVRLDLHLRGHLHGRDAHVVVKLQDVAALLGQ